MFLIIFEVYILLIAWNALCSPLSVRHSAIEMTATVININNDNN